MAGAGRRRDPVLARWTGVPLEGGIERKQSAGGVRSTGPIRRSRGGEFRVESAASAGTEARLETTVHVHDQIDFQIQAVPLPIADYNTDKVVKMDWLLV